MVEGGFTKPLSFPSLQHNFHLWRGNSSLVPPLSTNFGATDSTDDTTDSAQPLDLQRGSIWWPEFDGFVSFVLQWDGKKVCRATYLRSNRLSLHWKPIQEAFVCPLWPRRAHQPKSITDCGVCACVYVGTRCAQARVCVVCVLLSKGSAGPLKQLISWLTKRVLNHKATERASDFCIVLFCFRFLLHSGNNRTPIARHGGRAQSVWSWN